MCSSANVLLISLTDHGRPIRASTTPVTPFENDDGLLRLLNLFSYMLKKDKTLNNKVMST